MRGGLNTLHLFFGNGKVLVAGGFIGSNTLNSAEQYAPSTEAWTMMEMMKFFRHRQTASVLPNVKVLVSGGYSNVSLNSAELF